MFEIYKHTFENGKSYIGLTKIGMKKRLKQHIFAAKKECKTAFQRALRKYDFKVQSSVLATCETLEQANELEKHYIKVFNTFSGDKDSMGYNQTRGGEYVGVGDSSYTWDVLYKDNPEKLVARKEAQSKIHKGKKIPQETKDEIRESVYNLYNDEKYVEKLSRKSGVSFKLRSERLAEKEAKNKLKQQELESKLLRLKNELNSFLYAPIKTLAPSAESKSQTKKRCFKKIHNLKLEKDYFKSFLPKKRFIIALRMKRILLSNDTELIKTLCYWMGRTTNSYEYYLLRGFDDLDEIKKMIQEDQKKRTPTRKEYWINKGFTEEEAIKKVAEVQSKFSKITHQNRKRRKENVENS